MSRRALLIVSLVVGCVGAVGTIVGFAFDTAQAAFSYLTAWLYAVSIALGALIFIMIGHAAKATWFVMFRRLAHAIVASLPVLAVGFTPIACNLRRIYAWAAIAPHAKGSASYLGNAGVSDVAAALGRDVVEKLEHHASYLNPTFFVIRAVAMFAIWIVLDNLLKHWSSGPGLDDNRLHRVRAWSCAGLPVMAFTLTFASFDWLMSLTPAWQSTVFGLLFFSGGFVGALAAVAVIARDVRRVPAVAANIRPSHTGALGRLLLAFLLFWAYMEFSQGLIIWIANKPDEARWYVARVVGAWGTIFVVLIVGHFGLAFLALLSRPLKRRPTSLALVGWWLLLMHYVDTYWMVMPVLHPKFSFHWLDVAAPLAVIGIATAFATVRTRVPIDPRDPRFAAAVAYEVL